MARKTERTPPPDAGYIAGLYQTKLDDGLEAKVRTRATSMRLLTEMEHRIDIPDQYKAITKEVRTPFTRDTWLRVTAALTQNDPVAHVEPRDDKTDTKRSAQLTERWTENAKEQMNDALGEDVVYEDTKALVRDSEAVIKVVHRPDAWANFPRKQKDESSDEASERQDGYKRSAPLPFAWRTVDRLSMQFGDGEFGDDWAIEYGEYPRPYLQRRYGMVEADDRLVNPETMLGGKPAPEGLLSTSFAMATKIEFMDADWWAVVVDGSMAPGYPKPNPYAPHLPYFRAKIVDPVLLALQFLVPSLDALLTMKMNWAHLAAYPNPVLKPVPNTQQFPFEPDGDAGDAPAFTWKPGKMLQLPPGYDFQFASPPPAGQDLNELISILRSLIDVAGVPSVFRGVGGADQAGYAINQLIAAANLTYKILGRTLQRQMSQALSFLWFLVDQRIKQCVYVGTPTTRQDDDEFPRWLGLSPEKKDSKRDGTAWTQHLASMTYRFRPVLPTDQQARAMIANQLVNAPKQLLSKETAMEKLLEIEDPQGEQDKIWVEQALEEEPLRTRAVEEAMRKAGLLPQPQPNPAAALIAPDGSPLLPNPFPPGQMGSGLPAIPGLTQPMTPGAPQMPAISMGQGGRAAGSYPGRPGGVPGGQP